MHARCSNYIALARLGLQFPDTSSEVRCLHWSFVILSVPDPKVVIVAAGYNKVVFDTIRNDCSDSRTVSSGNILINYTACRNKLATNLISIWGPAPLFKSHIFRSPSSPP